MTCRRAAPPRFVPGTPWPDRVGVRRFACADPAGRAPERTPDCRLHLCLPVSEGRGVSAPRARLGSVSRGARTRSHHALQASPSAPGRVRLAQPSLGNHHAGCSTGSAGPGGHPVLCALRAGPGWYRSSFPCCPREMENNLPAHRRAFFERFQGEDASTGSIENVSVDFRVSLMRTARNEPPVRSAKYAGMRERLYCGPCG